MFVIMAISLYSSRIVLQVLGASDYGLSNVVGGFIAFFFFITTTLSNATQRFLSFEIGKNSEEGKRRVFSIAVIFFLILSFLILTIGLVIGIPFVKYRLNVPAGRENVAIIVYVLSLIGAIFSFLRVPYNAAIIAYEKMSFYSWISIIESILKFVYLYFLISIQYDKLIVYTILQLAIVILITAIYIAYCKSKFNDFSLKVVKDLTLIKQMASYSGWNFIGGMADVVVAQGLTIILNQFFGTIVNAAQALATHVRGQVAAFVVNITVASSPAIVQSYASGEYEKFKRLLIINSKIAYFMLLVISLPICFNLPFLFDIWLGKGCYPEYTVAFSKLVLIKTLVDTIPGLSHVAVQATGQIKKYQLVCIIIKVAPIIVSGFVLFYFPDPSLAYFCLIVFSIPLAVYIIYKGCALTKISLRLFYIQVVLPVLLVSAVTTILGMAIYMCLHHTISNYFIFNIVTGICILLESIVICYSLGLTKDERSKVNQIVKCKLPIYSKKRQRV